MQTAKTENTQETSSQLINEFALDVQDWGLIEYSEALEKQLQLVELVDQQRASSQNQNRGCLVFCSHPAIVTLGRKTQTDDVFAWEGQKMEVSRGGRATYHGPSQLVVYCILDLLKPGPKRKSKDIDSLLREMENAIIATLSKYGISSFGKSGIEETGVWINQENLQPKKIASIGIAIKKWISFHGVAINIDEDPKAFQGMKPCGLSSEVMTSLQKQLPNSIINRQIFKQNLSLEMSLRL